MSASTVYVRCKVLPGMFDNELYVIVSGSSVYVNQESVKLEEPVRQDAEVRGLVAAYLIDKQADRSLVELSGQPAVGGLRTWVDNRQFAQA